MELCSKDQAEEYRREFAPLTTRVVVGETALWGSSLAPVLVGGEAAAWEADNLAASCGD